LISYVVFLKTPLATLQLKEAAFFADSWYRLFTYKHY